MYLRVVPEAKDIIEEANSVFLASGPPTAAELSHMHDTLSCQANEYLRASATTVQTDVSSPSAAHKAKASPPDLDALQCGDYWSAERQREAIEINLAAEQAEAEKQLLLQQQREHNAPANTLPLEASVSQRGPRELFTWVGDTTHAAPGEGYGRRVETPPQHRGVQAVPVVNAETQPNTHFRSQARPHPTERSLPGCPILHWATWLWWLMYGNVTVMAGRHKRQP